MHDGAIRYALRERLLEEHPDRADTLIRDELGLCLGRSRVDVAVINGLLSGFEIKGPRDNLDRLPGQVAAYGEVLDRATIVTSLGQLAKVRQAVPNWWGLWTASESETGVLLTQRRMARPNPGRDPLSVAQLLWRDEVADILRGAGHRVPASATRWTLWDHLVEAMPLRPLLEHVRAALKARREWPGGG
jgi:hypothetical protein